MKNDLSLEKYLEMIAQSVDNPRGLRIRTNFADNLGQSELAMLSSPTNDELQQLKRAVAIMTPGEKQNAENLTDQQIRTIAADARIDPANLAIFINGYILAKRKPRQG